MEDENFTGKQYSTEKGAPVEFCFGKFNQNSHSLESKPIKI